MYALSLVTFLYGFLLSPHFAFARSLNRPRTACDAPARIELAKRAVAAIVEPTLQQSVATYTAYPFSDDASITVNPNHIGGIQVSHDRQSTISFLAILYELLTSVEAHAFVNTDDTHNFFNVTVVLGALHAIPTPVEAFFDAYLTYTLEPCKLQAVYADATVPKALLPVLVDILTP
ncbi:hypothetical protein EJ05DRAFT_537798 [Pseudovirgaria hyperparasitica]|uniref:Uncharacterized protein n=1 Tax=Pseudovirgaria hyperparasitica TaxID=470096 RepID=A0A6A6W912_9PEZI|nr:uncharacterized protein EJ05DRAFT_537798 [Pseudovirgaria hyperparasitica]KAF2758420.1 hypothetical protein EJ05DRAFT_537798 [Pseudovirgaria hyperparasitica]